jgi:hypothetical protein
MEGSKHNRSVLRRTRAARVTSYRAPKQARKKSGKLDKGLIVAIMLRQLSTRLCRGSRALFCGGLHVLALVSGHRFQSGLASHCRVDLSAQ